MLHLPPALNDYLDAHASPEPPLLAELRVATHRLTRLPRMLSGPYQGRLLALLSKLVAPRLVVDVGTFTGYSALCLAEGLAPDGRLISLDNDPQHQHIARGFIARAGLDASIELRLGDAVALLQDVPAGVDLAFLDADKTQYRAYYDLLLPKLRVGGILLTDNVLWSGRVVDKSFTGPDTEALRAYNSFVASDPRVEHVLLPVRDGLYLVRKVRD